MSMKKLDSHELNYEARCWSESSFILKNKPVSACLSLFFLFFLQSRGGLHGQNVPKSLKINQRPWMISDLLRLLYIHLVPWLVL